MGETRSYDVRIKFPNADEAIPFMFGQQGGVKLGNFLREPSPKGRVDSILIQSLHHGAGRLVGTDPFTYRDANGDTPADVRQFGFISPGGALTAVGSTKSFVSHGPMVDSAGLPALSAATFIYSDNKAVFAVGSQMFTIDPESDTLAEVDLSGVSGWAASTMYFTGSSAFWHGKWILGVCDSSRVSVGSLTYPDLTFYTSGTGDSPSGDLGSPSAEYYVSWIASTATGLYWIANRGSGKPPRMFWTDRTDEDWGSFTQDTDPTLNFLYGPFFLEIPTLEVTGMGVAGTVAIFASADQMLWAFDSTEVFVPLSPINMQRLDSMYGRQLPYVLDWIMVPNKGGVDRFDPRSYQTVDITPGAHQGSWVGFTPSTDFLVEACNTTPSGAAVITRFGSANSGIHLLEVYNDGMFWHIGPDLGVNYGLGCIFNTSSGLRPRIYTISKTTVSATGKYIFHRYDISGPGAQTYPETFAATSSVRTTHMSGRPPDVSIQPTQIRGWAYATEENPIVISLELDGSATVIDTITTNGPYVLSLPEDTVPCRRIAYVAQFSVTDTDDPTYVSLPVSIDYIYVPPAGSLTPDLVTLKVEATSNAINRLTGLQFRSAPEDADQLISTQGLPIELTFQDREQPWKCIIQDATAEIIVQSDGLDEPIYLMTLALKRVQ